MRKIVVMQCAGDKCLKAGSMRTQDGKTVNFFAVPAKTSNNTKFLCTNPSEKADTGRSWIEEVRRYNNGRRHPREDLLPAWQLYQDPAYKALYRKFQDDFYILTSAWGLVPATYRIPTYNITFAPKRKELACIQRKDNNFCSEINLLPENERAAIYYIGGLNGTTGANPMHQFIHHTKSRPLLRKCIYYISRKLDGHPSCLDGYHLVEYHPQKTRNWYYSLAMELAEGRRKLPPLPRAARSD